MVEPGWVLIHVSQAVVLLASIALAWLALRRLGAHTPYGSFLFVFASGLWLLLVGDWIFVAKDVLGVWERPGTLADLYSLAGWVLLMVSFTMLAAWFPRVGAGKADAAGTATLSAALGAAAALAALRLVSSPAQDASFWWRAAYIAIDGASLGALALGGRRLLRLQMTSLGRLYLFLATGMVLKAAGDLVWAYTAARGTAMPMVSLLYPAAGIFVLAGLALQARDIGKVPDRPVLDEPWLRPEQRALRDFARSLAGFVGRGASAAWLALAKAPLEQAGVPVAVERETLYAVAEDTAWAEAVEAGCAAAEVIGGPLGRQAFEEVLAVHGVEGAAAGAARRLKDPWGGPA